MTNELNSLLETWLSRYKAIGTIKDRKKRNQLKGYKECLGNCMHEVAVILKEHDQNGVKE